MNKAAVITDMRKSMDVIKLAEPIIKSLLNGGDIIQVEGDDNFVCKTLDLTCGIDYLHVYSETGRVLGVASRVQWGEPYYSFTVRKARSSGAKTEYEKRKYAMENGGIYPYLTMQIYADYETNNILALGIAKTADIMEFVDSGLADKSHTRSDKVGQAEFYIAYWDAMKWLGYKVVTYTSNIDKIKFESPISIYISHGLAVIETTRLDMIEAIKTAAKETKIVIKVTKTEKGTYRTAFPADWIEFNRPEDKEWANNGNVLHLL